MVGLLLACQGSPPRTPVVGGSTSVQPSETANLWAVTIGCNRVNVSYGFDFGDGSERLWTTELAVGDTFYQSHVYSEPGLCTVRVRARDETGRESRDARHTVLVAFRGPMTPSAPVGPSQVERGSTVSFMTAAGHVRGESVSIGFDWDGVLSDWSGFVLAGTPVSMNGCFERLGRYRVRARARDRQGNISPWSSATLVTVNPRPVAAPTGLVLRAVGGIAVRLRWVPGENDDSVVHVVLFRPVDSSSFVVAGTSTGSSFLHEPDGATGDYTVAAYRAGDTAFAAETVSTRPVATPLFWIGDLNSDTLSGFGWERQTGLGWRWDMHVGANADHVDWYFTDFAPGRSGPYYYVASPEVGTADPGGGVPAGSWRATRLTWVADPRWPLPPYDSLQYQTAVGVSGSPVYIGVHTIDGHYALISVFRPDTALGVTSAAAWFQRIPGLRLLWHGGTVGAAR